MGPLLDLSTLALASVVRDSLSAVASPPRGATLTRWLNQRLTDGGGELLGVVRGVCDRAWEATEVILNADALWERVGTRTVVSREVEVLIRMLGDVVAAFPPDQVVWADDRQECARQLRQARAAGAMESGTCEAQELAEAVAQYIAAAEIDLRRADEALLQSIQGFLRTAGCPDLANSLLFWPPDETLVVLAARTFLRQRIARDPRLLWGPDYPSREQPGRRHRRGLLALDDLQTQHPGTIEQWLADLVGPPTPPPPLFEESEEVDFGEMPSSPAVSRSWSSLADAPESGVELSDYLDSIDESEEDDFELAEEAPPPARPAAAPPPPAPAASVPQFEPALARPKKMMLARQELAPEAAVTESGVRKDEEPSARKDLRRRANVSWFRRMNPQRMYPLTVALAKGRVKEVKVKGVAQAVSAEQLVVTTDNPFITVRPVLPGVKVYPPEQTVDVTPELVTVRFHVVPQTPGEVPDARIEFYWRQRQISTVEVPMKVTRQVVTILVSSAGIMWPFLANGARAMGADERAASDFVMQGLLSFLRWPYAVEAGLAFTALLASIFYMLNRPKESSEDMDVLKVKPMTLDELLAEGQRCLLLDHWDEARSYFEDAVNVAPDNREAKHGLKQAQDRRRFPIAEMS